MKKEVSSNDIDAPSNDIALRHDVIRDVVKRVVVHARR